jgi:DNA-binding XRE family transcriptional regulator
MHHLNRAEFIIKCNEKLKLIRTEFDFSQEKAAQILGLSKKTVVEIEKGRSSLGWTGSVTLCTIFNNSEILAATFGGSPSDIILNLALEDAEPIAGGKEPFYMMKTMGGKVWWKLVEERDGFIIQQNIISQHYRILDGEDRRIWFSFDHGQIKERFSMLCTDAANANADGTGVSAGGTSTSASGASTGTGGASTGTGGTNAIASGTGANANGTSANASDTGASASTGGT